MPGADGMSAKFMKNAFVGWTFTAGLYYPPDFDQTKLMPLKHLRPKGQQQIMNIRMMFPFTMVCDSCHEYNYTGTKFTARVEHIKQESYLGLKVYRFYGRCRHCWAEFTFKTDPKNSDYTMESGGKRTYEAWKDADMMEAQLKEEKQKEAEQDQMKAMEQKSLDAQAEMQRLEDLDAIRSVNKRLGARDQTVEEALEYLFQKSEKEAEMHDRLAAGELLELKGFKEAQEEQKRQKLEDEVEGSEAGCGATSSTASVFSDAASAGNGGALRSAAPASTAAGASAAILSAVAERASAQAASRASTVGARLSVKRKGPEDQEDASSSKRPATGAAAASAGEAPASGAEAAAAKGAPASNGTAGGEAAAGAAAGGVGGLGLGAYDSDSS